MTRYLLLGILLLSFSARVAGAETALSGVTVAKRAAKVMEAIDWAPDLKAAQERAKKEKKLVFWLQLVGNLDAGL
jgi:hypothetical protein